MADLVITEFMDKPTADALAAEFDVYSDPELWSKRDELYSRVADARAIIVRNATRVDADLLAAAPKLKLAARMGVGLDNFDLEACKARNVEVCPSIGANAHSVAEYVITTALILSRGPAYYATQEVLGGGWNRQKFAAGREVLGRTMGIIGFGSIGQVVGQKGRAMGMEVIAYDAMLPADAEAWQGARRVDFDTLIAKSDFIVVQCPLLPDTRNMIDTPQFEAMKDSAIVINAARGGIINEPALAAALRAGKIAGAAMDTLETEPILPETGALFEGIDNLILTPHVAGVTEDSNRRIAEVAAANARRVLGSGT